jgi:hypothetical protein
MLKRTYRTAASAVGVASLVAVLALGAASAAQAAALPTLTLTITKSGITVGGTTESGAVNIVSSSSGLKEPTAILFALKPGMTVAEVEAVLKSGASKEPNSLSKYGSIVFDAEALPGKGSEFQTYLQPGQYVAVGGEGEGSSKVHTIFTVTAAKSPATLPTPGATIRTIEFAFRGPDVLHDGEVVRFENEGYLVHMDLAVPVKSKKVGEEVVKDLLKGKEKGVEKLISGPPIGFTGPVSHEAFQQTTITAKPGWYVQLCFMDTQDGRSHTLLGMERVFQIVK